MDDDDDGGESIGAALARVVHCVRADLDLERVQALLAERDLEAVAVIDACDGLVGVVTAREAVVQPAITVRDDEPVGRVAAIMAYERVEHLAVVSEAGEVLGVVTARDLLRWIANADGYIV